MLGREHSNRVSCATLPAFCSMDKGQTADVKGAAGYFSPNVCAGVCVQVWARVREGIKRVGLVLAWGVFFTIHTLHIQRKAFIHGAKAGKGWCFISFPLFTHGEKP